ncbi:MAG TPA: hypothetical protein VFE07_12055 [Marmoricola sp.]|nr:hypothetical protein [Marmoricola sp.]
MDQQTDAHVAPALLRHARRALLLLGGAFVWWLLAAGSPAHAADSDGPSVADHSSSSRLVADGARSATAKTAEAADDPAGTVSDALRVAPGRLSSDLDATTAAAPEPVRPTVRRLTTATSPILGSSATLLADTVDRTVHTVRQVVEPVLTVGTTGTAASATAATPPTARGMARASTPAAVRDIASSLDRGGAMTTPAGGRVVPDQKPTPRQLPSGSTPASAPSGPSGSGGSGACLGVLWLLSPLLAPRRRRRADDPIRPGPAFPPGCSPD